MKLLPLFFVLLMSAGLGAGLSEGTYLLGFGISDLGFSQQIEISNIEKSEKTFEGIRYFDVRIFGRGALTGDSSREVIVQGMLQEERFSFTVPYPYPPGDRVYRFVGTNKLEQKSTGLFLVGDGTLAIVGGQNEATVFEFFLKPEEESNQPPQPTALSRRG